MPIPKRLATQMPSKRDLAQFTGLCREIERRLDQGLHVEDQISTWNARAARVYSPEDFRTYHAALSTAEFVREALLPRPGLVADLAYNEAHAVVEAVLNGTLGEAEHSRYLSWLDANLPGAEVSELIYWPDRWFNDSKAGHLELTAHQILRYAMERSGRVLPGGPAQIELPLPLRPRRYALVTPSPT